MLTKESILRGKSLLRGIRLLRKKYLPSGESLLRIRRLDVAPLDHVSKSILDGIHGVHERHTEIALDLRVVG